MSWDPNAGASSYDEAGGYGNYGNYSEQPQQQFPAGDGKANATESSYDMFGANAGYGGGGGQQSQSSSFYNPNDYSTNQGGGANDPAYYPGAPQSHQAFKQPGPTNAYRSSPVPPAMAQQHPQPHQQQQQNASFAAIQGLGAAAQMNPVMTDMAMRYGQDMMGKGQEELKKNLDKYVSIGQLKYYFAVDTTYVAKKLGLLLFPFSHTDWSIKYSQDEPVQPKYDTNAPDLYIPSMAYLTYVLLVGYVLGLRNAFSPDALAATASSALVWLVLELVCIYLSITVMSIGTNLSKWDVLSFSTYKYVSMIALVAFGLVVRSTGAYYAALAYVSGAILFFLGRTLKLRIEPEVHGMQVHGKRKLYMILFYSGVQPLLIWWMTQHLIMTDVVV